MNHKINISSDYNLQDKIKKLSNLNQEDQLRLIYEWVKTNIINRKEFLYIVDTLIISQNKD